MLEYWIKSWSKRIVFLLQKVLHSIVYYSIEVKGRVLVEEDWSAS